MALGDRIELEITKVVHEGWGLGRHQGYVVFVSGTLPGERVIAEVFRTAKSHAFAHVLEVREASAHRIPHIWPEADSSRPVASRAGGADYGHIALPYQRALKAEIIRDALIRQGKVDPEQLNHLVVEPLEGREDGTGYRTRVTLHVDSRGQAGPYAEGTHTVVWVNTLPLATEALNALGAHRRSWQPDSTLRLVQDSADHARVVDSTRPPQPLTEIVGDIEFVLDDQVFWQVHHDAPRALSTALRHIIEQHQPDPEREHWDVYGGVGLFARILAGELGPSSTVVSVESDPAASGYAAKNLSAFPKSAAVEMDTLRFLRSRQQTTSSQALPLGMVVLDPPRQGAGQEVVSLIAANRPQVVVYVACDPVALARDVASFRSAGFTLSSVEAFDLFPHTHHVEVIASFVPG